MNISRLIGLVMLIMPILALFIWGLVLAFNAHNYAILIVIALFIWLSIAIILCGR